MKLVLPAKLGYNQSVFAGEGVFHDPSHLLTMTRRAPRELKRWAVSLETKNEKLTGLVFCRLSNQVTAKNEKMT